MSYKKLKWKLKIFKMLLIRLLTMKKKRSSFKRKSKKKLKLLKRLSKRLWKSKRERMKKLEKNKQ